MTEGSLGRGRHLAEPQFPDDDGAADDLVRRVIAAAAAGQLPVEAAARALRGARLMATVAAVLDAIDENGGDKDSHMAVVSMVNAQGEKGLPRFGQAQSSSSWWRRLTMLPASLSLTRKQRLWALAP